MGRGSGHGMVVETRLAEQMLDGAQGEVETQSKGGTGKPFGLVGLPQSIADRLVDGTRHGDSSGGGWGSIPLPYPAQTVMSG
jgi:hypothetical protein